MVKDERALWRENFSDRLYDIRTARGLTRPQVCDITGLSPTSYWRYESGRAEPTGYVILKLAAAFRVSTDVLLCADIHRRPIETALSAPVTRRSYSNSEDILPSEKRKNRDDNN